MDLLRLATYAWALGQVGWAMTVTLLGAQEQWADGCQRSPANAAGPS